MAEKSSVKIGENVVVLMPVYNEATVVGATIHDIPDYFKHIVCVDDGSSDATKKELLQTRASVVSHPINLGQGAALQTAIEYALLDEGNKYFVTYDADGQHNIKDVENMIATLKDKKLDIVLGSRFLGEATNIKQSKRMMLKMAIKFTNFMSGVTLTDTHNGLRVFTRETAEKMQLTMADFTHASEIIDRISELKLQYEEIPVTISYSDYSRSKGQSLVNSINIVFDVVLHKLVRQ